MITSRKNILILAFTLLVVMLGYGMIQPLIPFLVTRLGASGGDLGILTSMYAAMQLVCAPVWGMLSDRYGRKPVLMAGVLGYAITMFIFGLATNFWMLFVARTFSGVLSSAAMPTAMAYISDTQSEGRRSSAMGQLGAAMGLGMVLGPLLGGVLSANSLALPFFAGSGLALLALLLVFILLPESHPIGTATAGKKPLPAKAERFWQPAVLQRILLSPAGILMLLIFIMSFGMANLQGIVGLYALARFTLDTGQVGALWMVIGAVMIVSQGVLTGLLTRLLGEIRIIRAGLAIGAAGFVFMLLAGSFLTFTLATGIFILAIALIGPALNAHLSRFGGESQGSLMGLNTATASLGRVAGPLWAGFIYDVNPVYPFASGAVSLLLGFGVSLLLRRSKPEKKTG